MKVTVNQKASPSQQMKDEREQKHVVSDAKGRVIDLRRPDMLAQYRLVEALGDSAKNEVFFGMVMPLLFVSSIDGDVVHPPLRRSEVDALIVRLGEDGVTAVMKGVQENFAAKSEEEERAALKN